MQILFNGAGLVPFVNLNGIVGIAAEAARPPYIYSRGIGTLPGDTQVWAYAEGCCVQGAIETCPHIYNFNDVTAAGAQEGAILMLTNDAGVQGGRGA